MTVEQYLATLKGKSLAEANHSVEQLCGIVDFFESEDYCYQPLVLHNNRIEYGDWQTNLELALLVCNVLKQRGLRPQVIIEPTCGIGAFIIASLMVFADSVRQIIGIEIYKPYITQLKFRILEYSLTHSKRVACRISVIHQSIFDINFNSLNIANNQNVFVLGNPPWVTNTKLSEIDSKNLPSKSNFKKIKGLDAITGKGNFDIAESITYKIIDFFQYRNASLAFLIKSSVAKNVVYQQNVASYNIASLSQYVFDAKREFDVAVSACLLLAEFGSKIVKQCNVYNLYDGAPICSYGWINNCFASNIQDYLSCGFIDGRSQLTWWSGLKHDCSKVMELQLIDGRLVNKLKQVVEIEPDLEFPLLKSSDLKGQVIDSCNRRVIVTQKSTSDSTDYIAAAFPQTYNYLNSHSHLFEQRGSVIYAGRSRFAIFGIGDYSFKPFKVAISGLYKSTLFSLVMPIDQKPVMLDDTCYFVGFEHLYHAMLFQKILNSDIVQRFLRALIFVDAKRCINKELLMRIDLLKAANRLQQIGYLSQKEYSQAVDYLSSASSVISQPSLQLSLF